METIASCWQTSICLSYCAIILWGIKKINAKPSDLKHSQSFTCEWEILSEFLSFLHRELNNDYTRELSLTEN